MSAGVGSPDRILPHLLVLAIRLGLPSHEPPEIVPHLRTAKIALTYNPKGQTLTASTPTAESIFTG
ncbi:hypothetical protein [Streptomyces olivaceiscleroticus]|uniref:Uncharacterized protein n=1 Tax=Streptomyces olivaceiscleroticus TaxID=68245 RepID=A0ABP3KDF4_9ACTN